MLDSDKEIKVNECRTTQHNRSMRKFVARQCATHNTYRKKIRRKKEKIEKMCNNLVCSRFVVSMSLAAHLCSVIMFKDKTTRRHLD